MKIYNSEMTFCKSTYISTFQNQKTELTEPHKNGRYIFTSFHISEEFDEHYKKRAIDMSDELKAQGYKIVADISRRVLEYFDEPDIVKLAKKLNVDILRIDYGFSKDEIMRIISRMPVAINASTASINFIKEIARLGEVVAIHNFYPRPETGLDERYFTHKNEQIKSVGIPVYAFIPGNKTLRAPLYRGLPTLEKHRDKLPFVSFVEMKTSFCMDGVFIGDGSITSEQERYITDFIENDVMPLPVKFTAEYEYLYEKVFTVRVDSPWLCIRLKESREYSLFGEYIKPDNCAQRNKGDITIDNINYKRYSGEIQILREDLPQDEKVNVIGKVKEEYAKLPGFIRNGNKFKFVR